MKQINPNHLKSLNIAVKSLHKEWLRIAVKELQKELRTRAIRNTGKLEGSIAGNMLSYNNGGATMEIQYLLYGMMVDMNVGRGRSLDKNRESAMMDRVYAMSMGKRLGRRARKHQWYSRRMGKEEYKLGRILVDFYADAGMESVAAALPLRIDLTM